MKKTKKLIVMLLIIALAMLPGLSKVSFADEKTDALINASTNRSFVAGQLLYTYTADVVGQYHEQFKNLIYMPERNIDDIVFIGNDYQYISSLNDNIVKVGDAQIMLREAGDILFTADQKDEKEIFDREFKDCIARALGVDAEDVVIEKKIGINEGIKKYLQNEYGTDVSGMYLFECLGKDYAVVDSNTTEDEYEPLRADMTNYANTLVTEETPEGAKSIFAGYLNISISAYATTDDGVEYCYYLVLMGSENEGNTETGGYDFNFVWVPSYYFEEVEPEEFKTVMEYIGSITGGKEEDGTFYPPYFENDRNAKDADVTVKIKSTTGEPIVAIKVGDEEIPLNEDGTPNKEGWKYSDKDDKRIIEKEYPFDKYDNTTDCGKVKEEITLIGESGQTDTQTPSIEWTFRRINTTTDKNADGTTTVTIEFNLPVDESSIPEGWKPIYDEDGKTIHKITRTFGKDETYDKDVIVKQLRNDGKDVKVTTHITIAPKKLPKTGETFILTVLAIGIAVFAITRYRKFKNTIK